MSTPQHIDLSAARIGVLLNTSSGSCDVGAEAAMVDMLAQAGLKPATVSCGASDHVPAALEEAARERLDVLIVLGGDGTIRAAAEACGGKGVILVPLPGGTMNMLPKAIYGAVDWRTALAAVLANPTTRPVHGGRIGDNHFFVAAILGSPTLFARAREAARQGNLAGSIALGMEAWQHAFKGDLRYRFGDKSGATEALSVLCPLTSRALGDGDHMLECALINTPGALEVFGLGLRAAFQDWRADPNIETARVRRVEVESDQPIPAIVDGEIIELGRSATVEFVEAGFLALAPRPEDADGAPPAGSDA
jgi:diacylglycerol kinase family enzyme